MPTRVTNDPDKYTEVHEMTHPTASFRRPGRLPAALLTMLVLLLIAATPSVAAPGDYTQHLCFNPDTGKGVGTPPELTRVGVPTIAFTADCTGQMDNTGAHGMQLFQGANATYSGGQYAALQYDAPAGLTIRGGNLYRTAMPGPTSTHLLISQHGGSAPSDVWGAPWGERLDYYNGPYARAGDYRTPFAAGNAIGIG